MTTEQIMLVRNNWKTFRKINPQIIGDLFYSKLFSDNPRLQKMFPSSMQLQHRKLIDMLSLLVSKLDEVDVVGDDLRALALRHRVYGAKPEHYKQVGEALLWTIEQGVGNEWNHNLEEAWMAFYNETAKMMLAAIPTHPAS